MVFPTLTQCTFAAVAGALTTFSPCVFPILPFVLGAVVGHSRWAVVRLALGLAGGFTVIGGSIAATGSFFGLAGSEVRLVVSLVLVILGLAQVWGWLHDRVASGLARVANLADAKLSHIDQHGPVGQLLAGALLGAVWSPCSGPTLGAAIMLAGSSGGIGAALLIMFIFGLGAALPLMVVALVSREVLAKSRGRLVELADWIKRSMGWVLIGLGLFVGFGIDRQLETWVTDRLPEAWVELTSKY